jgi:ubiquinone/menaquinone biosynthesis C-methylase UbiE
MSTVLEPPPQRSGVQPSASLLKPAGEHVGEQVGEQVGERTGQPQADYVPFRNGNTRNGLQALVEVPLLIRALRLPTGGRVLEVGCGRGVALPALACRLAPTSLIGLDIDPSALDDARQRLDESGTCATLITGDVRDIPLESSSADLVIDFGTCYHVSRQRWGARLALREISRVLRPGGLFVHETPVAQHLAHPVRSFGRTLPWDEVPMMVRERAAILWAVRRKRW